MLLDLRGFRGGTEEIDRQFAPEAFDLRAEHFRLIAGVRLVARATKDAQKVRLSGRIRTTLETD